MDANPQEAPPPLCRLLSPESEEADTACLLFPARAAQECPPDWSPVSCIRGLGAPQPQHSGTREAFPSRCSRSHLPKPSKAGCRLAPPHPLASSACPSIIPRFHSRRPRGTTVRGQLHHFLTVDRWARKLLHAHPRGRVTLLRNTGDKGGHLFQRANTVAPLLP